MIDLSGKKALVTGATGGLGRAIACQLHAQGAVVALSGTREAVLNALRDELGERAYVTPANLGDRASLDNLPKIAAEAMGGIDILVNNAGITRDNLALRMKQDDWADVFKINLEAAFFLSKSVLRSMMKNRWGRIIAITSVVGVTGNPGQTNYAAAKAGLIGMSKSLAQEVASRGITVNCVAPGFIHSDMTDALNEDQTARILAGIPAGAMGDPADIAASVAFLASDDARYITGQTLHVNGGMVMV